MGVWLRKFEKYLPEGVRCRLYRRLAVVPQEAFDQEITIQIAQDEWDLERAFELLHDAYVQLGIMKPNTSGMRCGFHAFSPYTTTIVAKYRGEVIGTVSVIRDSKFGLPTDAEYPRENDRLRTGGKALIEVSALAVDPRFRGRNRGVSLLLMKYLQNFACDYLKVDHFVIAVHPRAEIFYKALFLFERNGEVVSYGDAEGAMAVHMSWDASKKHISKVIHSYGRTDVRRNIMLFLLEPDRRFRYPSSTREKAIFPVLEPKSLNYLLSRDPSVWRSIEANHQLALSQIYRTFFEIEKVEKLARPLESEGLQEKAFRTPVRLAAMLTYGDSLTRVEIHDLTSGGCFIKWEGPTLAPGQILNVNFELSNRKYKVEAQVVWENNWRENRKAKYLPNGVGIRFLNPVVELDQEISEWLLPRVHNGPAA